MPSGFIESTGTQVSPTHEPTARFGEGYLRARVMNFSFVRRLNRLPGELKMTRTGTRSWLPCTHETLGLLLQRSPHLVRGSTRFRSGPDRRHSDVNVRQGICKPHVSRARQASRFEAVRLLDSTQPLSCPRSGP